MENIEAHIAKDKEILENPTTSPQQRRHIEHQLDQLERYQKEHPEDHHDPTDLELWCEDFPEADECRIYEDWTILQGTRTFISLSRYYSSRCGQFHWWRT